jgi:hypothetical protein
VAGGGVRVSTRDLIAAALSTVAGVTGHGWVPRTVAPGQAWCEWEKTEYESTMCVPPVATTTWSVAVVLPADTPMAFDSLIGPVAAALAGVGSVVSAEPGGVTATDGNQLVPALMFTLTTNP